MKKRILLPVAAVLLAAGATPASADSTNAHWCGTMFIDHIPQFVIQLFIGEDGLCR